MEKTGENFVAPIIEVVMGLWQRAERDFYRKDALEAFRKTCNSVLLGEQVDIEEPPEGTPRESVEWARYVAFSDCKGLKRIIDSIGGLVVENNKQAFLLGGDDSDSESGDIEGFMPIPYRVKRRKSQTINPSTDRRFKANKTDEQIDQMHKNLEQARLKATEVLDANRTFTRKQESQSEYEGVRRIQDDDSSTNQTDDNSDVEYIVKRKKNSPPQKVPLPPLPMDYRLENEWVKSHIKSPDMLYSYVRAKAGDGVRWSNGMRKYFESNDFWEFAFDTLSCGGWQDSEFNRPICNVSKYITKVIIGEYSRHEATKHSRFEGKFKTGIELRDYVQTCCSGIRKELLADEYCSWFLQKMNDCGWRWNNGATINNIPGMMSKMFPEFKEWCGKNGDNLAGLNPNQYGETLRIQNAIERGDWKPRENGKFCAMDLLKLAKPQT